MIANVVALAALSVALSSSEFQGQTKKYPAHTNTLTARPFSPIL